jgi:mersacidin/lichenicidin family type 2 lantibiotic
MSKRNVIRAWKDPAYRNSLNEAERSAIPANPAGAIEISDEDLGKVAGGFLPIPSAICTWVCISQLWGRLC